MNWIHFREQNKDLSEAEAIRKYRQIEEQRYLEEANAWQRMNEARKSSGSNMGGVAVGGSDVPEESSGA